MQDDSKGKIRKNNDLNRLLDLGRYWWEEVDLNHRSRRRQIYSLIHLAALESAHIYDVALFVVEPVIGLEPTTC